MGIYPVETFEQDPKTGWLKREYDDFSGLKVTEYFEPVLRIEDRKDCFCCSCDEVEGSDAACRNHGHYGKRPCEEHNMPGFVWEDSDEMPDSVQEVRRKQRARMIDVAD